MRQRIPPRIVATRHVCLQHGISVERIVLERAPTTLVCQLQAIMGGWWQRSGGYPIGRDYSTRIG